MIWSSNGRANAAVEAWRQGGVKSPTSIVRVSAGEHTRGRRSTECSLPRATRSAPLGRARDHHLWDRGGAVLLGISVQRPGGAGKGPYSDTSPPSPVSSARIRGQRPVAHHSRY